ncbi:MAG: tRNA uridine-5-carboxymethylaminomethyl(34) synthesis enzyme MnmG, partial [Rhizobiaceae bacterium]
TKRSMAFLYKAERLAKARRACELVSMTPNEARKHGFAITQDGVRRSAFELMSYSEIGFSDVANVWPELAEINDSDAKQIEIDAGYAVYMARQQQDIDVIARDEARAIPSDFDYSALSGLSNELKHKLQSVRPTSLGQAGRIDGITPAGLTLILAHLKRLNGDKKGAA